MRANRLFGGHGFDGLGAQVLGVRAGEADPVDAFHICDTARSRSAKSGRARGVPAAAHSGPVISACARQSARAREPVMARSRPYELTFWPSSVTSTVPRAGQVAHLGHDFGKGTAHFLAPHRRDNAKSAAGCRSRPGPSPRRQNGSSRRTGNAEGNSSAVCGRRLQDLDQRAFASAPARAGRRRGRHCGCRTRRRPRAPAPAPSPGLFGPGSRRRRSAVRALLFQGPQLAQVAVKPVVGVLPDAARVENHDVGILGTLRPAPCPRIRRGRPGARSRARSSGSRKCAQGSGAAGLGRRRRLAPVRGRPFAFRRGHSPEPTRPTGSPRRARAGARRANMRPVASVERVPASLLPRRPLK